jgi:predicted ribosome quality control (RQC) complex YloA/Tae2 family protein
MPKIDIYVNGVYVCSTTQSRNIQEAKRKFLKNPRHAGLGGRIVHTKNVDASRVVCKYAGAS